MVKLEVNKLTLGTLEGEEDINESRAECNGLVVSLISQEPASQRRFDLSLLFLLSPSSPPPFSLPLSP
jgi:hypothetical protein